ncbi:hypothetical protein [Streptomyces erythrochromogenes]|uniref:hypothetical protein n=1 Tax=Streptomyces erythrochromogenes TaxID=285574 RepID=UPI0036914590
MDAKSNFIGMLRELKDMAGFRTTDELYRAIRADPATAVAISRTTFYDAYAGRPAKFPEWEGFCRPLIAACLRRASAPGSPARANAVADLGSMEVWRTLHYRAERGEVVDLPFTMPSPPDKAPSPTAEALSAKAERERARSAILGDAGVVETLRSLYPQHPLVELWGQTMPICAYPAAPTTDLETVLGRLHGSQLPEWAEYDGEFDPIEGREAFDRYVERYRTSTEAERRSFFPGSTYALHELRLGGDGGPRLDCKLGRYFTSLATSEDLDEELMAALAEDPGRPVPLERLDRRRWLHDRVGDPVVDGRHHSAAVSHGTVVMLAAGGGTYDVLLPHRSQHVATHSHFNHIAPSGIFAPQTEEPFPPGTEFSVERNFYREWVEEIYAADEHERPRFVGPPDPAGEPEVLRLKAMLGTTAQLYYTGISVNLLTLRPEICLLLVIDDVDWLRQELRQRRPFRFGWEYAQTPQAVRHRSTSQPGHWSLRLDADLRPAGGRQLHPSYLVPNAAAALDLAVKALTTVTGRRRTGPSR